MGQVEYVKADFLLIDALPVSKPCLFSGKVICPQIFFRRGLEMDDTSCMTVALAQNSHVMSRQGNMKHSHRHTHIYIYVHHHYTDMRTHTHTFERFH